MKLNKITKNPVRLLRKTYDDACATAHAMDLIGERWVLLIMREMMLGPKRFTDLKQALSGISANILTQRLEGLEQAGIVRKRQLPPPAVTQIYELTPWGYESEPIFQAMGRWAVKSPAHDPSRPFSTASLILSLRTMFCPKLSEKMALQFGLIVEREQFIGQIANQTLSIDHGELTDNQTAVTDFVLTGSAGNIAAFIYGGQSLELLQSTGAVQFTGNQVKAVEFSKLFPLPDK